MDKIKKLQEQREKINKQIKNAEQKHINPLIKKRNKIYDKLASEENKQYLGRYFKFMNSYDGTDKWPLYLKVVGVGPNQKLITRSFQKTKYAEIEINQSNHYNVASFQFGYIEISEDEYENGKQKILEEVGLNEE